MSDSRLLKGATAPVATAAECPCTWCGTMVEAEGDGPFYCCSGCEVAAAMVSEAGLDAYFADREALPPRPLEAVALGWDRIPTEALPDGTHRARLRVDGLQCAACVWVTERVLQQTTGVLDAQVSYATGRTQVRWDPETVDLDAVLGHVARLGYSPRTAEAPAADASRELLLRLGVAIFSGTNVMMLAISVYLGWWSGMDAAYAALFRWVSLALATPVALWSAGPFYRGAWAGLRHGVLHMDLPVSVGVVVLYGHGVWATIAGQDAYLDSLTMLVALLLAGRVLEQRGRRHASEAASALASSAPRVARRAIGDRIESVSPDTLVPGDVIEVASGEEVAADGRVLSGEGSVQMALLTGESEPAHRTVGDRVVAGAVLVDGAIQLEVVASGADTLLARMVEGLREANDRRAGPTLSDRIAPWFTAATLSIAALTCLGWWWYSGLEAALEATIAVLVVACPCALALSHPVALAAGLGAAARRGLLFRSGEALQALADVDLVALDKTGTVTGGRPVVIAADDHVLRVAAGIERSSVHPIGRAIVEEASRRGIAIPLGRTVEETPGKGIRGWVDGVCWEIRAADEPGVVEVVGLGRIQLRDTIRGGSARTLDALRREGLELALVTGDHPQVARRIARAAGLDHVVAGASPEDKRDWILARQAEGRTVLFVGDGINDGPALTCADVGLAMGSGAASSVLVADAVVAADALGPVLAGVRAAKAAQVAMRRNLHRSVAYNIVAVLGAVAGLVNPLVAAILMPLSSALVVLGALSVERAVAKQESRG